MTVCFQESSNSSYLNQVDSCCDLWKKLEKLFTINSGTLKFEYLTGRRRLESRERPIIDDNLIIRECCRICQN